uniref:S9 family peptidase n=1 Tax=uncultured Draconibacterium sp. TaxID=1573823 RepID=UPI0032163127
MKRNIGVLIGLICISFLAVSQPTTKKKLSTDDFASWNIIAGKSISNNGELVVYEQNPLKGDGKLFINTDNNSKTFSRGYKAKIGSENDVVVFYIKSPADSIRKAKLDKVKKEKMPNDSLGIYFPKSDELVKYPNLKSFKLAEENASWLAFLKEAEETKNDSVDSKKKIKQPGDDLVLINIGNKDTINISNIIEYSWAKKGSTLLCVQQLKDSVNTFSTIKWFDTKDGKFSDLYKTRGWVKKVTPDERGEQCVFLMSQDTVDEKIYTMYISSKDKNTSEIITETSQGMPVGWSPSEYSKIYFSEDGSKIYLGTAKSPLVEPKDTLLDEEKPKVDVWNWKDLKLQPQQLLEVKKEKERTYLAVYHISKQSFVQLADLSIRQVSTIQKGNGNVSFGYSDLPYKRASGWTGGGYWDYYLIDQETGIKRQIVEQKAHARLSPKGNYVIWWEPSDSSYYSVSTDINDLENVSLTRKIPVSFFDELNDRPTDARPYGIAGWSEDDRYVFIYDRYDIWKIDATGEKVPVCITKAFGRKNQIRLRYEKLDKELEYIPANETIILGAFNEETMSAGYFETKLNSVKDPALLIMDNFSFKGLTKAKNADKIIWTKESISTFPDVWCSNLKFEHATKLSEANPQQDDFTWPEVELVEWTSFSGEKLKGLLYKPENLNPGKNYPMIVYFYERSSETMHWHVYPKPSHSTINKSFYTSNGYLVFVPDITYKIGYPGESAYDAIVSGTQYLSEKYSFINRKKIGLQGQSWGGYQTAWLITQTDMYAAAMAGAPVSNMTSAYGGIRWGTGISRMFQYEHTQSRIGGTLWDKPLLYIENSPVFHAPKVNTPLLMMHNDKDGAVPWYQGIEMFVALRRLDKPVWLLNYNGEEHNLPVKSWANRMDLSKRMFQFFNHYLKDEPAPVWMKNGIPAVEKGRNLGYE